LAEGTQQRTMAIIRTSPTSGYYVDVFRSRSTVTNRTATTLNGTVTNQYHDYIYRNIGETTVDLRADGVTLPLTSQPNRFQNDIGDVYQQPGWRYFTNTAVSYPTSQSVKAQFVATIAGTPRYMSMHMPAVASREYAKVDSPPIIDAPSPYDTKVAPTLVVRQIGEAWNKAFATVYEPHYGSTGGKVMNVSQLVRSGVVVGVKVESTVAGKNLVQYVIANPGAAETYSDASIGLSFTGRFGIASDNGDGTTTLYLGEGSSMSYRGNSVATTNGASSQAEARFSPGQVPVVTSNTPVNAVAAGFTWVPTAGGGSYDWTSTANWNPAVVPDGVGVFAFKNTNITGNQTVNINTPVTLGELVVGDSSGAENTLLQKGTSGSLMFDQMDNAMAFITRAAGGTGDVTFKEDLDITLNDNLTVRMAGGTEPSTMTIAGTLSGAGGGLTKEGDELTLVLSGNNTYTGNTTLAAGLLRIDNAGALGSGNLSFGAGGILGLAAGDLTSRAVGTLAGQVQWTGSGGFAAFGGDRTVSFGTPGTSIPWTSTNFIGADNTLVLGHPTADGTLIWDQALNLFNGSRTVHVNNGPAAIDAKMSRFVTGGSTAAANIFNKTGAGTLALTANNFYNGNTTVSEGVLMIGDGGGTGGVSNATPNIIVASGATLAMNRSNTLTQGTANLIVAISGGGGFAQVGPGTTEFAMANVYTGPTSISAGTLKLNTSGVLPDTSAVSIGSATLNTASAVAETSGTLAITGTASINLGTGATLAFANSSALSWTGGTLRLTGAFVSGSSLRFGTNSNGLTPSQLALVSADGFTGFALNGNGYLTANAAIGFSSWVGGAFSNGTIPADQRAASDDFDNDGVSNLMEFAIAGQDPTVANPSVGSFIGGTLSFAKRPGTSGLIYAIEESDDLGRIDSWAEVAAGSYVNNSAAISYAVPAGQPKIFLRLRVSSE
jgi:autotransporter-associated beta strand protein